MIDIMEWVFIILISFFVLSLWYVYYNLYTDTIEDLHEKLSTKEMMSNLRFARMMFLICIIICIFLMYSFGFIIGVGGYISLNEIVKEYEGY